MSKENVNVVRTGIEALNRRDLDAVFALAAPDCVFDLSRAMGIDHGLYTVDQWRAAVQEFMDTWESVEWDVAEYIDAGEQVVTPLVNRLRGRAGIEVEARVTWLWTLQNGLAKRVALYQERAEALEAAGLSE